jgi:hypothetical protein
MLADDVARELEAWERRCRGYQVWDYHVELEPPYSPLLASVRAQPVAVIDDGRKAGIRDLFRRAPEAPPKPKGAAEVKPRAFRASALIELQLVLPEAFQVKAGHARDFLSALHNLSHPVAFELVGVPEGIIVQLCVTERDRAPVLDALCAFFPEIKVREHTGLLEYEHERISGFGTLIDFGLSEYSIRLLKAGPNLETDPLIGIVGALNELLEGELGLVQVVFAPACGSWGSDLWDFAQSGIDDSASVLPMIRAKYAEPVMATLIRVAGYSRESDASFERARSIGNALIAATRSDGNILVPLENDGYAAVLHAQDILRRETHRSGMLLNLSELLTLVHLPTASVRSDRLMRQRGKTKAAPEMARHTSCALGINEHDGEDVSVGLSIEQRLRHTYLIGASGTGKSTLMLSMIDQDIQAGRGVAVLDPHGDLVDDVLARIPEDRLSDVILLDPGDEDYPVGFNTLSAHPEIERILLSSDLVGVFKRLATSWGDQMTSVMGNAVLAFLESSEGGTLLDLRRFLVDKDFRKRFLFTVRDPEVVYFWEKEFTLLKGTPQAPLLTRLDTFLRPKLIRYMVAQKKDRLDLRAIMDDRKILLAKLSQGAIGEENSYLLGSLLVAKINQAAMSRQAQSKERRVPFFLYIDEFHNFVTPSIASILSGARKYGLGLTLAHQDTRQLKSRSDDVLASVLGNAYSRVMFRVSEQDARALADGLSFFEPPDLLNLGVGQAIARVEQSAFDFNLSTSELEPIDPELTEYRRQAARELSRAQYATSRTEIEELLRGDYAPPKADPASEADPSASAPKGRKPAPSAGGPAQPASNSPRTTEPPKPRPVRDTPQPGRGGPQHKYLQSLIKRVADDRGFRTTIEKPVLDGHGHIDVALEHEGLSVAVEISITTDVEHELGNLSKCVAAGFDYAVLVCSDKQVLGAARTEFVSGLSEAQQKRLRFLTPEGFFSFLDEALAELKGRTETVRGYKVSTKFKAPPDDEKKRREKMLEDVISKSLKRKKKK